MSQSQVWKKKVVGLTNKLAESRQNWLHPNNGSRKRTATATLGQHKAGLKRRDVR